MSRLSREQKRELKRRAEQGADPGESGGYPAAGVTPVEVRVYASAEGIALTGGSGAVVDGRPVLSAPGQNVQAAVLDHLHHLALSTARPVLAEIHDERTGYVVPIQVYVDGSSAYMGEPRRFQPRPPQSPQPRPQAYPYAQHPDPRPQQSSQQQPYPHPDPQRHPHPQSQLHPQSQPHQREPEAGQPRKPAAWPTRPTPPTSARPVPPMPSAGRPPAPPAPRPDPVWPPAATGPEPSTPAPSPYALRTVHEPGGTPPGVAGPPTGEFGPAPDPAARRTPPRSLMGFDPDLAHEPEPEPKPVPVRGFDAVAEAVLAPVPELPGEAAFLAEPVARINEAVQQGRIEEAAGSAEQTVAEAAHALGPEHPEVLRLRELGAYIAYLADDAPQALRVSLDLARIHRRSLDPEAAYGNVQSAATAWRAIREPSQGLAFGRDLIGVWTELAADGGPAADDLEQLESARTRMGRLAERVDSQAGNS
ncbi:tetratricopeptide repeat protein [Streptomyces sp. NPDC050535]|uniref:tetratricopeptide repeat protein n=1 Tax=Streptomyces sp. NPDC050535 TaxID=3365626 RepID=UPI003787FA5D